jgi:hypothetical protein
VPGSRYFDRNKNHRPFSAHVGYSDPRRNA